jgi:hypothetical protein
VPRTKKIKNEHAEKVKEFCKYLYPLGWHTITLEYDGYGDSCEDFEQHIANEEEKIKLEDVKLPPGAPFEFKDLADALARLLPCGFEDNEGGYGTMTVNIKTGAITVDHNERYIESVNQVTKY